MRCKKSFFTPHCYVKKLLGILFCNTQWARRKIVQNERTEPEAV